MKKSLLILIVLIGLASFTGCPDYSHLREVPDYPNMTDGGEEFSEEETEKK